MSRTVRDIVIEALTEYVNTVMEDGFIDWWPQAIAEAAYNAVADEVARADSEAYLALSKVMMSTVEVDEEPDDMPWPAQQDSKTKPEIVTAIDAAVSALQDLRNAIE